LFQYSTQRAGIASKNFGGWVNYLTGRKIQIADGAVENSGKNVEKGGLPVEKCGVLWKTGRSKKKGPVSRPPGVAKWDPSRR
jgi:hypothetical protein